MNISIYRFINFVIILFFDIIKKNIKLEEVIRMKNKEYWLKAIKIAWPSVLESFFLALAVIIDTIMVSRLGPSAVAAVGLTNQPKFIGLTAFSQSMLQYQQLLQEEKDKEKEKKHMKLY